MPDKDPAKQREFQRQWMARRKEAFFSSMACAHCGATSELELHHLNPSQKVAHRIWSWSAPKRQAELAKCIVLCHACHQVQTNLYARERQCHLSEEVQEEVRFLAQRGERQVDLAERYRVSRHVIHNALQLVRKPPASAETSSDLGEIKAA